MTIGISCSDAPTAFFRRSARPALWGSILFLVLGVGEGARAWAQAASTHWKPATQGPGNPAGTDQKMASLRVAKGYGELINLAAPISDIMVSNPAVADIQVRSPRQIYLLGKAAGETSVFAVSSTGRVVYAAQISVGLDLKELQETLSLALPGSNIQLTPTGGLLILSGVVATPADIEQAERIVKLAGSGEIINRLKTAAPVQVNLQVRFAEVNRQVVKNLGINLLSRDTTGGFLMGIAQGRKFGSIGNTDISQFPAVDASSLYGLPAGSLSLPFNPKTGKFVVQPGTNYDLNSLGQGNRTNLGFAGKLLGLDLAAAIDLAENQGLASTLAQPNLTAVSGQTASFLAGGEVPLPVSGAQGQVGVEFKSYGVSLSFTPTVLADGRISMRVKPEVSQLAQAGSVQVNGFAFPGLSTRRVETTVELGSGQSFMIGGLLQNNSSTLMDRAPGIGSLPILGALFRSTEFRKNQTELVVIVTPYLVKPVSEGDIHLPTDGLKTPSDADWMALGHSGGRLKEMRRPQPSLAGQQTTSPQSASPQQSRSKSRSRDLPKPGFGQ